MKKLSLSDGQEILTTNLEWLQTAKEESIIERLTDCFDDGILNSLSFIPFEITSNGNGTISINIGVAFKGGERIEIDDSSVIYNSSNPTQTTTDGVDGTILTPKSTGCKNISILANTTKYIGVRYLLYCDNGNDGSELALTNYSIHPRTDKRVFYTWKDGYEVILEDNIMLLPADSVYLGYVTRGAGTAINVDMTLRTYSALKTVLNTLASDVLDNIISTAKIQNGAITIAKLNSDIKTGTGVGYGLAPQGGIVMWSGPITGNFDINGVGLGTLAGWALCNGNSGRPDLRDKFILSVGAGEEPGGTGGSNTVSLIESNLPAHTHTIAHSHGDHDHGTNTGYVSHNHRHSTAMYVDSISSGGGDTTCPRCWPGNSGYIDTNHYHAIAASTISLGATASGSTGSGTAFSILPTYYKLAFIMKL